MDSTLASFARLIKIMDELREQCPWDKKQTIHSLRHLTIEETYELADAIDADNYSGIKEELGDLLLHIVFYARIGREQQAFELKEILDGICEKLIVRHPHIYSDTKVASEDDVKQNWEKIKLKQGKKSLLEGVPKSLPSVVKAMRLQEKTKQVGFEWDNTVQVMDKVEEEMAELRTAMQANDIDKMEDEMGDVLFSLVNLSRFLQVDAEAALERTNKKFIRRFTAMEAKAAAGSRQLHDMTLGEMDALWNEVKASGSY